MPKERTRRRLAELESSGRLQVLLGSTVTRIEPARVELEQAGRRIELPNADVIVCAGGILRTAFLKGLGIQVDTKFGAA